MYIELPRWINATVYRPTEFLTDDGGMSDDINYACIYDSKEEADCDRRNLEHPELYWPIAISICSDEL